MNSFYFLFIFALFANVSNINGLAFDDATACLKDKNLPFVLIRSFAEKFIELIANTSSPLDEETQSSVQEFFNVEQINGILEKIITKNQLKKKLYKTPNIVSKLNQLSDLSSSYDQIKSILIKDSTVENENDEDENILNSFYKNRFSNEISNLKILLLEGIIKLKNKVFDDPNIVLKTFSERNPKGNTELNIFPNLRSAFDEFTRIQTCLRRYEDTHFEDTIQWLPCFYVCRDLRRITSTLASFFDKIPPCRKSPWLRDVIIRMFMQVFALHDCHFEILKPNSTELPLEVTEGDLEEKEIVFQLYTLPGVYCFPPQVTTHMLQVITQIFKYVFRLEEYCKVKVEISSGSWIQNFKLPVNVEFDKNVTFDDGTNKGDDSDNDGDADTKLQNTVDLGAIRDALQGVDLRHNPSKCHTGAGIVKIATKTHKEGLINKDEERNSDKLKNDENSKKFNLKKNLAKRALDFDEFFNKIVEKKEKNEKAQTWGHLHINDENWNQTFVIPVATAVTHKYSHDEHDDVNITFKMVVDNERINSTKITTRILNTQPSDTPVCQSINDPHLTTFDHVYYNNLYHGYFILYKHDVLPYEVQVIYQGCGSYGASCTCGVAVRAGDDVVVVDRCRRIEKKNRKSQSLFSNPKNYISNVIENQSGKSKIFGRSFKEEDKTNKLNIKVFKNGLFTKGFRLFRKSGGLAYQILLPHGSVVTIQANAQGQLNAWIFPSPYDFQHTSGLCGFFNGNKDDDFLHSDGTHSNITHARKVYPKDFIESWRVKEHESVFQGVKAQAPAVDKGQYCRCVHGFMKRFNCKCSYGELVETCDLDLGDEWTQTNLSSLVVASVHQETVSNKVSYKIDMDESYEPDFSLNGTKLSSKIFCARLLLQEANSMIIKTCALLTLFPPLPPPPPPSSSFSFSFSSFSFPSPHINISDIFEILSKYRNSPLSSAMKGCVDDIDITQSKLPLPWKLSAIDSAKKSCLYHISRRHSSVYRLMAASFKNDSCVNSCYFRGSCVNGECDCDDKYHGPDCGLDGSPSPHIESSFVLPSASLSHSSSSSFFSSPSSSSSSSPPLLSLPLSTKIFCNLRNENCSYVKFSGNDFKEDLISCTATQTKRTPLDRVDRTKAFEAEVDIVNPNQAVCVLPATTEVVSNYYQGNRQIDAYEKKNTVLLKRDSRDVLLTNKKSHSIEISFSATYEKRHSSHLTSQTTESTMNMIDFIVYDSVCQTCEYSAGECQMKKNPASQLEDYCVIDGTCVGEEEEDVWNTCLICNTSASHSVFTLKHNDDCLAREQKRIGEKKRDTIELIIRITASVVISLIIIIITIVLFIKEKNRNHNNLLEKMEIADLNVVERTSKSSSDNKVDELDIISKKGKKADDGDINNEFVDKTKLFEPIIPSNHENLSSHQSRKTTRPSHHKNETSNTRERAESTVSSLFYREPEHFSYYHASTSQQPQQQARLRTHSETSHGLGGSGPMLYGGYNRIHHAITPADLNSPFDPIVDISYHGLGGHATSLFPTSLETEFQ